MSSTTTTTQEQARDKVEVDRSTVNVTDLVVAR